MKFIKKSMPLFLEWLPATIDVLTMEKDVQCGEMIEIVNNIVLYFFFFLVRSKLLI